MQDLPTPAQKIVGLKLCWVVVNFVRWGRIQNFRPIGPLFLVEVEFPGGGRCGGMNSNNRVKPNLRLRLCWVVVRLGFWQFLYFLATLFSMKLFISPASGCGLLRYQKTISILEVTYIFHFWTFYLINSFRGQGCVQVRLSKFTFRLICICNIFKTLVHIAYMGE